MKKQWIILLALIVLVLTGILVHIYNGNAFSSGDSALNYFAAGRFSVGVFSAGMFSAGIFSVGIFSIGIFSVSVFNVALYGLGFFIVARHKKAPKVSLIEEEDNAVTA